MVLCIIKSKEQEGTVLTKTYFSQHLHTVHSCLCSNDLSEALSQLTTVRFFQPSLSVLLLFYFFMVLFTPEKVQFFCLILTIECKPQKYKNLSFFKDLLIY